MKSVPENSYLRLFHQIPWNTECLILHPKLPSGHAEGQQLRQHKIHSLQRQMANALGKHQFVVNKIHFRQGPTVEVKILLLQG